MRVWSFEKTAGQILDQQQDPGVGWDQEIGPYWPNGVSKPELGTRRPEKECLARLQCGHEKVACYPASSPEDALASSMYFLRFGLDPIEKEAHQVIAEGLQNARLAHGVEIPDGFVEHVKEASAQKPTREEVYADDGEHLPVTTREQCKQSIRVFEKNASKWSADDRLVTARKLQKAAEKHDLDVDLRYATTEFDKEAARERVGKRLEVMQGLGDHPGQAEYISECNALLRRISSMGDYRDLLKCASDLEALDRKHNMDIGVQKGYYPDAVETFIQPKPDPLAEYSPEKLASTDWSQVDFEGLKEHLDEEAVEKIASAPHDIIPSLPRPHQDLIRRYARGEL